MQHLHSPLQSSTKPPPTQNCLYPLRECTEREAERERRSLDSTKQNLECSNEAAHHIGPLYAALCSQRRDVPDVAPQRSSSCH